MSVCVPETPLHLCPTCDYILTGLGSRRCPECGNRFRPEDARRRGAGLRTLDQEDLIATDRIRIGAVAGFGLHVFAVAAAVSTLGRSARTDMIGGWLLWATIGLVFVGLLYKVHLERSWSESLLAAGIPSATLASLVLWLS